MRFTVAIRTSKRAKDYLGLSVRKMVETGFFKNESGPTLLVVDSEDTSFLDPYRRDSGRFKIVEMSRSLKDDHARYMLPTIAHKQRIALNHSFAISAALDCGTEYVMILEDDVWFADPWFERVKCAVQELWKAKRDQWALSFFSWQKLPRECAGKAFVPYYPRLDQFHGPLGMVYPRRPAASLARYFIENCVKVPRWPADLAMIQWSKDEKFPIMQTVPNVLQHIGDVGVGGGARKRSEDFPPIFLPEVFDDPAGGGIDEKSMRYLHDLCRERRPRKAVDLGTAPGLSLMSILAGSPGVKVWTVEHELRYLDAARGRLKRENYPIDGVTFVHAPAVQGARTSPWYDVARLSSIPNGIDLLHVDGLSPGMEVDAFLGRLSARAVVLVNGCAEAKDQAALWKWRDRMKAAGKRLECRLVNVGRTYGQLEVTA